MVLLWSYDIDIFLQLVTSFRVPGNDPSEPVAVESSVFGRVMTGDRRRELMQQWDDYVASQD